MERAGSPEGRSVLNSAASVRRHDLYLSPHFDDICFSLGSLVSCSGEGKLINFFTNSFNLAKGGYCGLGPKLSKPELTSKVTNVRRSEDLKFARRVGLQQFVAGFDDAPVRGRHPFENSIVNSTDDGILLNDKVMSVISAAGQDRPQDMRPWFYCPMGIGGHVDHLTILRIVLRNFDLLNGMYRIAFYEDLHYASNSAVREAGVSCFRSLAGSVTLKRTAYPIDDEGFKTGLVGFYESQLKSKPKICDFTPALNFSSAPHEAIWTAEFGDLPP